MPPSERELLCVSFFSPFTIKSPNVFLPRKYGDRAMRARERLLERCRRTRLLRQ
jgi:hypothetical protein